MQRIVDLAAGDYVRSAAENARSRASDRTIQFIPGVPDQPMLFNLAQYEQLTPEQLRKKLAQYPTGTIFHWPGSGQRVSAEEDAAFREVSEAAAKSGVKLVRD